MTTAAMALASAILTPDAGPISWRDALALIATTDLPAPDYIQRHARRLITISFAGGRELREWLPFFGAGPLSESVTDTKIITSAYVHNEGWGGWSIQLLAQDPTS